MMRRILTLAATILVASVVAGGANGAPVTSQGISRTVELDVNWNLVSWTGPVTAIEDALEDIAESLLSVHAFDNGSKQFLNYSPASPAFVNTLNLLAPGDALWVRMSQASVWEQPTAASGVVAALSPGFNLVTWLGPDETPVAEAVADIGGVLVGVFAFDPSDQTFDTFGPELPPFLNSLSVLPFGAGLWMQVDANVTWQQPGAAQVPSILSDDGKLPPFESFAPLIREIVIDDDPDSPVAAIVIFQPDDHRLDRLELYGEDAKDMGRPEFAVMHFTDFQTTALLQFDADGALQTIRLGEAELRLTFGEGELLLEYRESGVSLASGTLQQDTAAASASIRVAQAGGRRLEWRDGSCREAVVSVQDRTPVCLYIEDPALAGQTIDAVQVVEVDPLFNDPIGRPLSITFDSNGVGTATFIAGWRDDGTFGGDPEYRFDLAGGAGSSPKLYVSRDAPSTELEIQRAELYLIRVEGEPLPEMFTILPVLTPGICGNGLSCSLWVQPGAAPTLAEIGIVYAATTDFGEPVQGVPLEFCGRWGAWAENAGGSWVRGEWISRDVWDDPAVALTVRLLGSGAALNIVEGAAAATAWQLVLTALVGALAYEGGRMLGEELTGREGLDCEALKRQTDLLTDFATELRNLEVSPELCMTPVPGWKWEPECQTVTDRPFDPSSVFGGHLVFTLRAIEPVVSLDGSTTVTADADATVSYAARAVGGASDEYTWRITPEPTFLFTGEGQASWGLIFPERGPVEVCAEATDVEGNSTEACLQVSVERAPWTSQTTCGEFGEGSDFSHTWKVHLVDNKDGTFGGVVAFHDCPGGGRARYLLSGEAPPGSATITLKGRRNLALGPLGTKAPATLDFSFTGIDPPSPNLAPRHDLGIALAVSPATVPIGAPVTHVITVVNNGPETATNVLVSATITGATPGALPSGCEAAGTTVNCTIDSLAVGGSATFTFDVSGSLARLASTSVRFRFPDFGRDPNFPNNSDDASYTVFDPDA